MTADRITDFFAVLTLGVFIGVCVTLICAALAQKDGEE